jgi:hypothetical protein
LITENSIENPQKDPPCGIDKPMTSDALLCSCIANCEVAGDGIGGGIKTVESYSAAGVYAAAATAEDNPSGTWP